MHFRKKKKKRGGRFVLTSLCAVPLVTELFCLGDVQLQHLKYPELTLQFIQKSS